MWRGGSPLTVAGAARVSNPVPFSSSLPRNLSQARLYAGGARSSNAGVAEVEIRSLQADVTNVAYGWLADADARLNSAPFRPTRAHDQQR